MSNQKKPPPKLNIPAIIATIASIITILAFFGITRFPFLGSSSTASSPTATIVASTPAATTSVNTPSSTSYPPLASAYSGTITNTSAVNFTSRMALTVVQNQGIITGYATLSDGVEGSGPFEGTINSSGNIHFSVHGTYNYKFDGELLTDHSLRGNFTNDLDQGGNWQVMPSQ